MTSASDIQMMARAIRLAERGRYRARPNPAVGCVLARGGVVIGEGSTQRAGGNHAEIEALGVAGDARGATAYVSLEPCAHHGKTGPCAQALIDAGIERVVIASPDPNPEGGGGMNQLRKAGISVHSGVLSEQAQRVNPGFFKRFLSGRPFLRVKLAASLDGRTAMASGESQWITGPAARADVQRLRGRSGAIVTGVETVLADDPQLTVRDQSLDIPGQPLRVVLDSRLRTPPTSQLIRQPGQTMIVHSVDSGGDALVAAGAELVRVPAARSGVDLASVMALLAQREVNEVLVECGPRLAGALLVDGLVDELVVYMAPTLLGSSARPLLSLPLQRMSEQRRLTVSDLRQVGDDYRWTLTPITE